MKREKKRAISQRLLREGERHNASFGFSKHRVARMHAFVGRQLEKERTRASAKRHRRHPCGGARG